MSTLPRVAPLTRERVAREFDDRGPEVCRTEIALDLEANNPEILDMATRCARDVGEFTRVMTGFCMFYRLLTYEARAAARAASAMSHAAACLSANPGPDRQADRFAGITGIHE
jgi:hypothetical protein